MGPTDTAMLPPDPDADGPLPTFTAPLGPTLAAPVLKDTSPDTPEDPALLVDTDTLPELVSAPAPDEIRMDPPEAAVPSSPSIVTAPPLVLPSPEARVKFPPLLIEDDPAIVEAAPPASPEESPAVTLNVPPLPSPEPTDTAMLPPDPDADGPLPTFTAPLVPTLAAPVLK